jgi:hypothetical protein
VTSAGTPISRRGTAPWTLSGVAFLPGGIALARCLLTGSAGRWPNVGRTLPVVTRAVPIVTGPLLFRGRSLRADRRGQRAVRCRWPSLTGCGVTCGRGAGGCGAAPARTGRPATGEPARRRGDASPDATGSPAAGCSGRRGAGTDVASSSSRLTADSGPRAR